MSANWLDVVRMNHAGSESGGITFPDSVRMLTSAGLDGYAVDFRRAARTYYMPDGAVVDLETERTEPVAERFDVALLKEAIREAQALVPGYTYKGFCAKVARAGCAGYLVSLIGKRVLYHGRMGETHTEYFPGTGPTAAAGASDSPDRPREGAT